MKIDRRSFLSFVIGGAAGTALSPLPWKLTDDLSIWTQNWPWTPVPPDGKVTYVNTACTLCPGGCGISVRKVDDRAIRIEGRKGHPVNDGGLCPFGLSGLQLLYGPTRVKTPLKREGNRGDGKWAKISWEEAVSLVAKKLARLRESGQSHTLGYISGSDRGTVAQLFSRFLTVYGSPNFFRTPSVQDAYELALFLMQGVQGAAGFDFENADFVLSFGSGIIDGWGSPVRMFQAKKEWVKTGAKVVQIEPRLSITAAKSNKWIPINPGTDAALALGLAHVIISESLFNKNFVDHYSFGFNDWTDRQGTPQKGFRRFVLEEYPPEAVAKITGIDSSAIVSLARSFANASRPLAICGRGQGKTPGSIGEFMAIHALNALVGSINNKGGLWAVPEPDFVRWPEVEIDSTAAAGMQKERIDGAGSDQYPFTRYLLNQLPEVILSGKEYPLQALLIADANPCYTLPDAQATKKAFDKIPFVVSFSSYMDETAQNADLILPNHTYLERFEDVPLPLGLQKPIISLLKPVVTPQFNTQHIGNALLLLAKALGGGIADAFPWDSYEDFLEVTLGDKWETLMTDGVWMDPDFTPPPWEEAFETPSTKFEFFPATHDNGPGSRVDFFPRHNSIKIEGDPNVYPLVLIPYDTMRIANSAIGNPPFVIKTVEDTVLKGKDIFVEINPKTAKAHGVSNGKYADLSTPKGSVRVKVLVLDGIMPGVVALPTGLGHTAYDKYLAGKGVNFNTLIGPVSDPATGLDAAWGIRARLKRS